MVDISSKIIGIGHSLASRKVDNEEVSRITGLSPDYILRVSGIANRYWCDKEKENLYVNMASAVEQALHSANMTFKNLDEIITVSNPSAEFLIPNTASVLAATLEFEKIKAHSVATGCAGGIIGLGAANNQLIADYIYGKERTIAVVAGDETSRIMTPDSKDRILFSDAAACIILTNRPVKNYLFKVEEVDYMTLLNDFMALNLKREEFMYHNGAMVYMFATGKVPAILKELTGREEFSDTYIVPHQPSGKTLTKLSKELIYAGFYDEGVSTIGNTSPASTFIGLEDALRKSLICSDKVMLLSFGEGLTVSYANLGKGSGIILPERLQDDVIKKKYMKEYNRILEAEKELHSY